MLSFLLNELAGNGDKKLKSVDLIAIGVGFGITLCLSLMILYYMIQGIRRRKRENPDGEKSVNGEVNVDKCLFCRQVSDRSTSTVDCCWFITVFP